MVIAPQQICAADAVLTSRTNVNGEAVGTTVYIEGGLEKLLSSDDELGWVIAHEAAHVFLGHSGADRAKEREDAATRFRMEQDADALGVRLMLRTGYAPEASVAAHPKIVNAGRGPISKLLDLHGRYYLGTRDRTEFLKAEIAKARVEESSSLPPIR